MSEEMNEEMPTMPAPPVPTEISLNGQTFEITTNAVDQSVCVKPVVTGAGYGGAKKARKSSKKQQRRSSKKQHRKSSKKQQRKSGKKQKK